MITEKKKKDREKMENKNRKSERCAGIKKI